MIDPVTNPANAAWGRSWRYRNIVQVVDTAHIAALELHSRLAAGRLEISEGEGSKARTRIEILINHYAVKEETKSVVKRRPKTDGLIEKAHIVGSPRCSSKGLANRVKIGTIRTKSCTESIVGRRQLFDGKVTSGRRRCRGPASEVPGLEIAVNDEVGRSRSGSGNQQNADGENCSSELY